jgi:Peptidase family M23
MIYVVFLVFFFFVFSSKTFTLYVCVCVCFIYNNSACTFRDGTGGTCWDVNVHTECVGAAIESRRCHGLPDAVKCCNPARISGGAPKPSASATPAPTPAPVQHTLQPTGAPPAAAPAAPVATGGSCVWVQPMSGTIVRGYRVYPRISTPGPPKLHDGLDIRGGTEIVSVGAGTVRRARNDCDDNQRPRPAPRSRCSAGNSVTVEHAGGIQSIYKHLKKGSVVVTPGTVVTAGQKIAEMGNSGITSGPHLHFTMKHNGRVFDPCTGFTQPNSAGSNVGAKIPCHNPYVVRSCEGGAVASPAAAAPAPAPAPAAGQ